MTAAAKGAGEARSPREGWLTAEEQAAWVAAAAMIIQLPAVLDAQLQRDAGITMFDYFVLSALSMAEGGKLRMSDLAVMTNGSLSRLSNVVKRLEQRGWVTRSQDSDDRRSTNAQLTPAGRDLVMRAAPGHVNAVRHFVIDPLTRSQIHSLTHIGQRIHQRITSERASPDRPDRQDRS